MASLAENSAKAVGYCRISTENQADGYGLDVQKQAVTSHAQDHGYELTAIHEDVTSGTDPLDQRQGLSLALGAVQAGTLTLIIPRLDRLARDLIIQETLLKEVWTLGGTVISCTEGEANLEDDPDDPSRALIRQVLGAVSQYERSMIVLRMRRGRAAKRASGGYAGGRPKYGWKVDGSGGLKVDRAEQETIRIARDLRAEGRTIRDIADVLTERKIPTKTGQPTWHPGQVARLLG